MHPLSRVRSALLLVTGLAFAGALPPSAAIAVDFPAPSPAGTVKQRLGLTDIEINYSRPGVKGRQIFGGLVPYGKVWRTGANSATRIAFSTPVQFGGHDVPAGTYGLYTIPGESEWTVILSKKTDLWGSFGYDAKDDFVRATARVVRLPQPVETFSISLGDLKDESGQLVLEWENTRVAVPIAVNYAQQLLAEIEKTMSGSDPKKPYHQAAQYYFDHGQDLQKARAWIATAVAENPNAYWSLHLQAKVLAKLGDKAGAVESAKKSIELATRNGDSSYVKSNNDLLATLN